MLDATHDRIHQYGLASTAVVQRSHAEIQEQAQLPSNEPVV